MGVCVRSAGLSVCRVFFIFCWIVKNYFSVEVTVLSVSCKNLKLFRSVRNKFEIVRTLIIWIVCVCREFKGSSEGRGRSGQYLVYKLGPGNRIFSPVCFTEWVGQFSCTYQRDPKFYAIGRRLFYLFYDFNYSNEN